MLLYSPRSVWDNISRMGSRWDWYSEFRFLVSHGTNNLGFRCHPVLRFLVPGATGNTKSGYPMAPGLQNVSTRWYREPK